MIKLICSALFLMLLAAAARAEAGKTCPWGDGFYCGEDGIAGDARSLYSCAGGVTTLAHRCARGCAVQPPYVNDYCVGDDSGSPWVMSAAGGPCGDYPAEWCALPGDSRVSFAGRSFPNRECTTYVAYKRWQNHQSFDTIDAGNWQGQSQEPTVGSVAIWNAGTVSRAGHVAYVTAVSGDSITVSEFNWTPYRYDSRVIKRYERGWPSRFWN